MPQDYEITFRWQGLDERIAAYRDGPEIVRTNVNQALHRIGQMMVPMLKAHTPVGASHLLRNRTYAEVGGGPYGQRLVVFQSAARNGYFYGAGVRGGTRPHMPPYRELIPWVRAVLGIGLPEGARVAWLIARKIARVGTRPNPYHVRALEQAAPGIQAIVSEMGVTIAARLSR